MKALFYVIFFSLWISLANLACAETPPAASIEGHHPDTTSPVLEKVSLQLVWKHQFEFAGYYAAIEKGYYRERGLDVELREYEPGIDLIAEVTSGRATFGIANSAVISERLNGADVVLLANYFKRPALVFVAQKGIRTLQDMRDKRLKISPKDLQSPVVQLALQSAGLIPGDNLEIVADDFNPETFIRNEVDVSADFITNEPLAYEQAGHPFNLIDIASYLPGLGDDYLFTSEEEAKRHPQRTKDFIAATNQGWRYALAHPDELINLILTKYAPAKSREALEYEAEKTQDLILPVAFPVGSIYQKRIDNVVDALVSLGQAPNKHRLQGFLFDPNRASDRSNLTNPILTDEEQAWVAAHTNVTIGYTDVLVPMVIVDKRGQQSGVLIDFLGLLEQRTGINFQLKLGNFKEVIQDAYQHKLDMLGPVYTEDVHREHLFLSSPLFSSYPYIYARTDATNEISSLADLDHKRVGYIAGLKLFERIFNQYPNLIPVPLKNNNQLADSLISGDTDAVIAPMTFEYWRKLHTHTGFKVTAPIVDFGGEVVLGVRNDEPMLSQIIEKGLASISERERQEILNRWFGSDIFTAPNSAESEVALSQEERAWLKAHPVIKTGIDPHWAPIEFFDQKAVPQGMSVAYLKLFEKALGVQFEVADALSWSNAQQKLAQGDIDLLPAVSETPQRSELYRFTTPYLSIPVSIFSAEQVAYLGSLKPLAGKKVAVVKDYAVEEWLRRDYPALDMVAASTVKEALRWVAAGEAFAFVGNLVTTSYYIGQSGLTQIHVAGETPYRNELGMAIHKDNKILQGILQKTLDSIPRSQRDRIYNDWISVRYTHDFDYKLLWQVMVLGALILAIVLYWTHRLSREVTRRRQVEVRLQKAKEEAERANKVKGEFLRNMSHEFRTPMNAVIGVGHLLGQTALSPEQSKYLRTIQSSSKILLGIIDNILDFSRIESGKIELQTAQFELREVMQELALQLSDSARTKGLDFDVETDDRIPQYLIGDAQRLVQILLNLAGNAVKFTDSGKVSIRARFVDGDVVNNRVRVKFTVSDTGPGIEQDLQKEIFRPFSQGDGSLTRQHGGSGLGLAISQAFANEMGSEISVESSPGTGSVFSFEVAFSTSQQKAEAQMNSLSKATAAKGLRILLVEDDPLNQKIASALLETMAASVLVAANGEEAIEALQSGRFDLVFMDLQMPGLDGYETVSKIRRNPAWRNLPIIAMTAHAFETEREKCLSAGMNDYLTKPVDPDELALTILRWRENPEKRDASITPADGEIGVTENTFSLDQSQPHSLEQRLSEVYGMLGKEGGSALLEETFRFLHKSISELGAALKNKDWSTASKLAHKMKGALFVCGDAELEALLDRVELLPTEADSAEVLLKALSAKVDALTKTSQQWEKNELQSIAH